MRIWIVLAGLVGAVAIILGAYAAHAVNEAGQEYWQGLLMQASNYLLIHAPVFLGIDVLARQHPRCWGRTCAHVGGGLISLGLVLFGGVLIYRGLTLGGPLPMANIAPTGGFSLIFGWLVLAVCGMGWSKREGAPS